MSKLRQFQLLGPSFNHEGRTYKRGQIVKVDFDLTERFKNSFQEVGLPMAQTALVDVTIDEVLDEKRRAKLARMQDEDPARDEEKPKAKSVDARGTDVTEKFKAADANGYRVFRLEKEYFVYEGDSKKPANKAPLEKDGVTSFIKDQLEE